ncbi:hypothetical protein [Ensifer canadensis]
MTIAPPTRQPTDPGYPIECQVALEAGVRALCDEAGVAGWSQPAVFRALAQLVERQARDYVEDPDPAESSSEIAPINLTDLS